MAAGLERVTMAVLLGATLLYPSSVAAQPPAPEPEPPSQEEPAEDPPADDGPKPAGVGSSQPPESDPEAAEASDLDEFLPPTSFPGVPLSGTTPTQRPFRGLFGGAEPRSRQKHSLTLNGSIYAAYSTSVAPLVDEGEPIDPRVGDASTIGGGSGSINYTRQWRSGAVNAFANGSRSWIEAYRGTSLEWLTRWDVGASGGFSRDLSRRTRVSANGSVTYSPYFGYFLPDFSTGNIGVIPGPIAGLDTALAYDPSVATAAGASLSYALSRKSSLEGYTDWYLQTFVDDESTTPNRNDQIIGGRYRYQFSRFVGLRAGYGYRRASFEDQTYSNHMLDVGVDGGYGRSYALTRRTTFSFSTNSGVAVAESVESQAEDEFDPDARFFLGGTADLTHAMGRTWVSRVGYTRSLNYSIGFDQPLLTDTVHASLGGLVTSRLDFSATATYTYGSVGFGGDNNRLASATAFANLRYAISRNIATYAQYFYYHYDFGSSVRLPSFLSSNLDRQGVSVGLTAWVPLIGSRGRR